MTCAKTSINTRMTSSNSKKKEPPTVEAPAPAVAVTAELVASPDPSPVEAALVSPATAGRARRNRAFRWRIVQHRRSFSVQGRSIALLRIYLS